MGLREASLDFEFVHEQRVRHRDGWDVFSVSRSLEAYEEDGRVAQVEVTRGTRYNRIHAGTLRWVDGETMDAAKRREVAFRIRDGMRALSSLSAVVLPDDAELITEDDSLWATRLKPILERNPNVTKIVES
jgi:hypothetical protein